MFNPQREMYVLESKRMSLEDELEQHRLKKLALAGKPSLVQRLAAVIGRAARLKPGQPPAEEPGESRRREIEQLAEEGQLALRNR